MQTYVALARKYRPGKFADLVGQDVVARTLRHALRLGRGPRAILFTGVRGIGKTTSARIYAKALNCQQPLDDGDACDQCASCQAITEGHHEDVVEMDGASHTGVDDVRALRDTLEYAPQRSKYRIYIIDEVHMLSTSAFNALLKSLEEPPPHVVFIFATTELERVPDTILSRCQVFHLAKISTDLILGRIEGILQRENIPYEAPALRTVARRGHGSLRDALTFLDQVVAVGQGQVTQDALNAMVDELTQDQILSFLQSLLLRRTTEVLEHVAAVDRRGGDFGRAVEDLALCCRHGMILLAIDSDSLDRKLLGLTENEISTLREVVRQGRPFDLHRLFRVLMACRRDLDGGDMDRPIFENVCLEWCLDPGLVYLDDKSHKGPVATETRLPQATQQPPTPAATAPTRSPVITHVEPPSRVTSAPLPPAPPVEGRSTMPPTWAAVVEQWKRMRPVQGRQLEECQLVAYEPPDRIVLTVREDSLAARPLLHPDSQGRIQSQLFDMFGFSGKLVLTATAREQSVGPSLWDSRKQAIEDERQRIGAQAREHPAVKKALAKLGGKIGSVIVDGGES